VRVLITEPLSEGGLALLRRDFEVDVREDLTDPEALARAIGPYDALIVRSQTRVTARVLEAGERLKVVARAGIGIDNVDVEAATRRGILVVNAPQSNVVSAAEHTFALLLAQARNIPQAHAALREGRWERARYQGVELAGKTLGIVGLGRVGTLVAQRALAFGMRVIAYDPYVARHRAKEIGVDLMPSLESLLVQSDFVSIHLPRTPDTEGLIGAHELSLMKEGARLVNTARGGIVDEEALAKAIAEGHLGGAALDVFAQEPPGDSPLFRLENVVVTPHLGAATVEAQDKAGTAIAEMVRLALSGEVVPYAVNLTAGAEVPEPIRPFLGLAERLGALLTGFAEGAMRSIECAYLGRIAEVDTRVLTLAALRGALSPIVQEPVSWVNAPVIAEERGIAVSEIRSSASQDYVNVVSLRAETEAGAVEVAGTLVGARERLTRVLGFELEMALASHMVFLTYADRPGVIGRVGTILGEHGINVGTMEVARETEGGRALMALTVDGPVPSGVLEEIRSAVHASTVRSVVLPG
jgi:D-3-phosphoglycerate dehydrogenase